MDCLKIYRKAIQVMLEHEEKFLSFKNDDSEYTYSDGVSVGYVRALYDVLTLLGTSFDEDY